MCVGFLYTEVLKVLSGCMVTSVSKKGNDPCCVGSTVNWMCGSWLLMCCSRSWLCHDFNNDFTLFTAVPVLFNMYTDRDSNLISDSSMMFSNSEIKLLNSLPESLAGVHSYFTCLLS